MAISVFASITTGQLGTENDIVELAAKGTIQFVSVGAGHRVLCS